VGSEVAALDGGGFEAAEGAGGQVHVGGIEQEEGMGLDAADEAGEVFGHGAGVAGEPIGMAEGARENRAEGVIAVVTVADAEEQVFGGGGGHFCIKKAADGAAAFAGSFR